MIRCSLKQWELPRCSRLIQDRPIDLKSPPAAARSCRRQAIWMIITWVYTVRGENSQNLTLLVAVKEPARNSREALGADLQIRFDARRDADGLRGLYWYFELQGR